MPYTHSERFTALDLSFLRFEDQDRAVHMHVGAVALFEPGPLVTDEGGIDIERIRRGIESTLACSPRFRQRLARVPVLDVPVWVDDDRFNLRYHVRHTALPRPGSLRQLKRLAARVFSQRLDRSKPLWEFWFAEGLEDGRFALIAKAHHALVDGIAGFDLLARILRFDPDPTVEPPPRWIPRPSPRAAQRLFDEAARRARLPLELAGAGLRALRSPRASGRQLLDAASALGEAVTANLKPVSLTPLNVAIGPYRRFDWTRFDLQDVKDVKQQLGGTVNDVVLCCVAGAVGRFLARRGERIGGLEFRVMVPMSVRRPEQRKTEGNRVVSLVAPLPIDETDTVARLVRIRETTRRLKDSRQAWGVELFEEIADRIHPDLFVAVTRRTVRRAYNLVVTNVPGPQAPAFLYGARMQEIYPLVPLWMDQALGIALFSYDGKLCWGLNADWDALPDLHDFAGFLDEEFETLRKAVKELPRAT
jgi:WS/DGAT/MGAT family acyltransferase